MPRYVFFSRKKLPTKQELEWISKETNVIDRSTSRILLVEATEETAQSLSKQLESWVVSEEVTYPSPKRPQIRIGKRGEKGS